MPSLLDRVNGTCAARTREELGLSPAARVSALERQAEVLRRVLVHDVRVPVGFMLGDDKHEVVFGPDGRIRIYSSNDSNAVERNPNTAISTIDLRSNACLAAVASVCATSGATFTAADCDGAIGLVGENDTDLLHTHFAGVSGSPHRFMAYNEVKFVSAVTSQTGYVPARQHGGGIIWLMARDPGVGSSAPSPEACGSS